VKDDDVRLSFLHGNYVTLTNLSRAEIERIAGYHLSPLRISVHAADTELRKKMMGCAAAENLFDALETFANAGISMHFQVVLCKEINDGNHLDYTIKKLSQQKGAESLAIVPAGRTAFVSDKIKPFTASDAEKIIAQIETHQAIFREKLGKNFVFAADEWYITANKPLPNFCRYEDFPQLDNGVGLIKFFEEGFLSRERKFLREKKQARDDIPTKKPSAKSGNAAAPRATLLSRRCRFRLV
jgi:putative radical SAM enzyme (TIGR03279 family)